VSAVSLVSECSSVGYSRSAVVPLSAPCLWSLPSPLRPRLPIGSLACAPPPAVIHSSRPPRRGLHRAGPVSAISAVREATSRRPLGPVPAASRGQIRGFLAFIGRGRCSRPAPFSSPASSRRLRMGWRDDRSGRWPPGRPGLPMGRRARCRPGLRLGLWWAGLRACRRRACRDRRGLALAARGARAGSGAPPCGCAWSA